MTKDKKPKKLAKKILKESGVVFEFVKETRTSKARVYTGDDAYLEMQSCGSNRHSARFLKKLARESAEFEKAMQDMDDQLQKDNRDAYVIRM